MLWGDLIEAAMKDTEAKAKFVQARISNFLYFPPKFSVVGCNRLNIFYNENFNAKECIILP